MIKKETIPAQPRSLPEGPLYFVGIGGAGMSAIAYVLAQRGHEVAGSDPGISAATQTRLESVGITVYKQHDPMQVGDSAALIATDAVNEQNPEVMAARERGIPVFRRPEALGAIFNAGRGIAISGTHGKTTTTGMVASILLHAGLEPTILIGGDLPLIGGNSRNGDLTGPGGDIVLAEACEAYDGFLYLHPEIAVITNIEADHLDFHGTAKNVYASFRRFGRQIKTLGALIISDDKVTRQVTGEIKARGARDATVYACGFDDLSSLVARNVMLDSSHPSYELWDYSDFDDRLIEKITLQVPGQHNVSNSLLAATVALHLSIESKFIKSGLEAFTGTGRRFERLGEVNGVLVIDDYAHHPTEIRATLSAARSAYSDRRIIAVFQPHLPSRTRDFMDDFADALGTGSDGMVVLTDIYLAREQPIPGVSSETLAAKVRERNPAIDVHYVPDTNDLPALLADVVRDGDLVLTMGAGDIRKAGEELLARLKSGK